MKIFIFSLINYIAGFHLLPEFTDVEEFYHMWVKRFKWNILYIIYSITQTLSLKVNWIWKDFSKMDELRKAIQAKKAKLDKMVHQFEDLHIPEGIILIDSIF